MYVALDTAAMAQILLNLCVFSPLPACGFGSG